LPIFHWTVLGLSRWNRFTTLTVTASITGALWRLKRTADLLTQVSVEALLREQRVTTHLVGRNKRFVFTPQRVTSETEDGRLLEARDDPRSAFRGQLQETAWDDLHVAYFSRTTQYSLLCCLARAGQVRQGDLVGLTHLEETTLTRNLRPLAAAGWVSVRSGDDRREKLVRITDAGAAKLAEARPAWERAQTRMQALLPKGTWQGLLAILPEIERLTAGA